MGDEQVTPNADQVQSLGWRAALPDEWKEHDFVKPYQKPGDFVKSAYEIAQDRDALKTRLENSIPKLRDGATDAERADYFKALGRPDKSDEYEISIPDGLPQSDDTVKWFQETSHKLGIPKAMAEGLAREYFSKSAKDFDALNQAIEKKQAESTNSLKREWGGEFQKNLDAAKIVARKIGGDDFMKYLNDTRLGDDPQIIKIFHKVFSMIGESAFVQGAAAPAATVKRTEGGSPILAFPSMEQR